MPRSRKPADVQPIREGSSDIALQRALQFLHGRPPESLEQASDILSELLATPVDELPEPAEPLDRAQMLVYDAWEEPDSKRRIAIAREALAISPDCADAYLVLAEESANITECRALTLDAVAAGRRAIGDDMEQLAADEAMWLVIETRPYLRALMLLGSIDWDMGDRQAAIAHGWELLRLNPGDNQGMRYVQLLRLMQAGSLAEIDRLLGMYPDDGSAAWSFGRALHLFRTLGAGPEADAALSEAKRANHHVVPYLLGEREIPMQPPEFIGFGDETEAAAYAYDALFLWGDAPGSQLWLSTRRGRSTTPRGKRKRKR